MSEPTKPIKKDNTKIIIIAAVAAAFVLFVIPAILFTVGATIIGHKAVNGVKVSGNGDSATITTKNGDQISTGSKTLPKDFPSIVPVYSGTIVTSGRLTIEGKVTYSVAVETKDDPTKVASTLSDSFSSNGWTTKLDNQTTDGGLITAENDQYHVQVIYSTKDGKTTISYAVVPVTKE